MDNNGIEEKMECDDILCPLPDSTFKIDYTALCYPLNVYNIGKRFTGAEFNEMYAGSVFTKLINASGFHNGLEFQTGLNVDPIDFNPTGACQPGGIYFTDINFLGSWLIYNHIPMVNVRDVRIPDDAIVYVENDKFKANKLILGESMAIGDLDAWHDDIFCINAVKQNLRALKYVKIRGYEMYAELFDTGDWVTSLCSLAALNGHLEVLKLALYCCTMDERTCANAALNGHLEVLKWIKCNGCPWDTETTRNAALNGHLSTLIWAVQNNCPWDAETRKIAMDNFSFDCKSGYQLRMGAHGYMQICNEWPVVCHKRKTKKTFFSV